ncbi:hypothetical protein BJ742DRAFT_792036 [Cladochytrium replicatum]|nr:hypothetical protein BJ742DRAFT_792036 [Cladochytrium replicatum]
MAELKASTTFREATNRTILVVFVHGFLGSHESFGPFPDHLIHCLEEIHGIDRVETKVYPKYNTKGSNARQVKALLSWLLLHATTVRYEAVIIVAHSMGGILAADVYRHLYGITELERKVHKSSDKAGNEESTAETTADPESASSPAYNADTLPEKIESNDASPISEAGEKEETDAVDDLIHPGSEARLLVNIRGIIAFDSPFYGLSPAVITQTGANKVFSVVSALVPKNPPHVHVPFFGATFGYLFPNPFARKPAEKVDPVPKEQWPSWGSLWTASESPRTPKRPEECTQENSEEGASGQTSNATEPTATSAPTSSTTTTDQSGGQSTELAVTERTEETQTQPEPPKPPTRTSTFSKLAGYALAGTAAASAAYIAVGVIPASLGVVATSPFVQSAVARWAVNQAEEARSHLEFLYPLVNSHKEMHGRVLALVAEQDIGHILFRCFYCQLPSVSDPKRGLKDKDKPRTFIVLPHPGTSEQFVPVTSHLQDEIDAHMNMFFPELNCGRHYVDLVIHCASAVAQAAQQIRGVQNV